MDISVIIPTKNNFEAFSNTFNAVLNQSFKPNEIIIVDSSTSEKIKNFVENTSTNIPIKFFREKNKYPGEARNIGGFKSNNEWIAFLDSKTIPIKNWLKEYSEEIKKNNYDIIFGTTKYVYKSSIQKRIRAASFGNIEHITTPGTIIKRFSFLNNNTFIENVRNAEDLEWRQRLINKKYSIKFPDKAYLIYENLPNNYFELLKRYFIYSFHTAQVNVENKLKFFYLFFLSFFLLLIVPRWNQSIPKWNNNQSLFIDNYFKIFLLIALSFLIIFILVQNFDFFRKKPLNFFLKFSIIFCTIIFIYNWNFLIAEWLEKSIYYFPHITKIYLTFLFITSFFLRGIYYPIKRKIKILYIFPFNWLFIGIYGLSIDLIKAPGYIIGALIPKHLRKGFNNLYPKIIFFTKYSHYSPSYRTRFLAYKSYLENNYFSVDTRELFDEKFYINRIFKNKINFFLLIYFYLRRIYFLFFLKKPFVAIIHIEVLPFLPLLGEIILRLRKIPFIIDIDDAVYYRFENTNKFISKLYIDKFRKMIKVSDALFAGNKFHINFFENYSSNIKYFPTVIDCKNNDLYLNYKKYDRFTVVWIGTPSTSIYLKKLITVLNKLNILHNIDIRIIGANINNISNLNCISLVWDEKTELLELTKCHIGIMPLYNTKWELGKCGFKILQYMSLKLPVIASPVGVNKEIIQNNYNGLLASSPDDWYNKILYLKQNPKIMEKFSENGYTTVKNKFNLSNYYKKYIQTIDEIYLSRYQ